MVAVALHLPGAQVLSIVQKRLSLAQWPKQFAFVKQLFPVPAQVPGKHVLDVHELLAVHRSPIPCSAVHVRVGAAVSQNRPFSHCNVDVHRPPAPRSG